MRGAPTQHVVFPDLLPPQVVSEEEKSDAASSMSDEPPPRLPQHHINYHRIPRDRRHQFGTKAKNTPRLKRSSVLQSTMDRIQMRNDVHAPSPTSEIQEPRDDDSEQVGHVLEMFSTYDALLEHLIRKNKNLKQFVKGESDYFPSSGSYTTKEVVNTLELLRRERANNPLRHVSGRRAISQPRPARVGNPRTWQETYPQPDNYGRRIGNFERGNVTRREDARAGQERHAVPPEIKVQDRKSTNRHASPLESREQTRNLLHIMKGYRSDRPTSQDRRTNGRTYDGDTRPLHDVDNMARNRGDYYENLSRNRLSRPDGPRHSSMDVRDDHNIIRDRDRRNDPDPIELLRAKNDREWLQQYSQRGDRHPAFGSDLGESQGTSAVLSRLLPERIPPKIKASRDRLAQFRNSRLRAREDNFRSNRAASNDIRRPAESLLRRNMAKDGYQRQSPIRSRYPSPRSSRPGSPDRPLHVDDYDEDYDDYEQRRIESERFDDFRHPRSRLSRQQPLSTRNERMASRTQVYGSGQHYGSLAHQTHRQVSEYSRRHDIDSSQEGSSVTPTEKARRLMSQVDDLYMHTKQVGASQEQMRDDLAEIKQRYLSRSNDRALQMRTSVSLEDPNTNGNGRLPVVSRPRQPDASELPTRDRQYRTHRISSPRRQPHDRHPKITLPPRFSRKNRSRTVTKTLARENHETESDFTFLYHNDVSAQHANDWDRPVPNGAFEKSLLSSSSDENSSRVKKRESSSNVGHDNVSVQISKAKEALYKDPIIVPVQQQRGCCL